jgi:hypothetical protein
MKIRAILKAQTDARADSSKLLLIPFLFVKIES